MNFLDKVPLLTELSLLSLFVFLVYGWLVPTKDTAPSLAPTDQETITGKLSPKLSELVAVPLFGKPLPQTKVVETKRAAPVQPLNIRVLGTVTAGDRSAAVILQEGTKEQQLVFVGDDIQPGIKLHYVDADAVVVDQQGQLQSILLEYSQKLQVAISDVKIPSAQKNNRIKVGMSALDKGIAPAPSQRQVSVSSLMTQGKLELHQAGNKADGFLITHIMVGSIYQKIGIYNGDIIRKINDTRLLQNDQVEILYDSLINSESLKVEVVRNGEVRQLSYSVR